MAKGINQVVLLGNLGKAPEVRNTSGGTLVASFSLATPERRKDEAGKWAESTEWHSCVAFGRTAEILRDYAPKGPSFTSQASCRLAPGTTVRADKSGTGQRSSSST